MSVLYLRLLVDADALLLRLSPDPQREERALARLGTRALSYLDRAPAGRLAAKLKAFAAACEGDAGDEADALRRLARAAARTWPGARLVPTHRVSPHQRVLRWPVALRSGRPAPGELWPYDAELTGMHLGVRRLILREWLDASGAEQDARWLSSHGLSVRARVDDTGRRVLFAARDEATLADARAWDAEVHGEGRDWPGAVRAMGDALGYPACCVERFLRVRRRDDLSMLVDLLPLLPSKPSSPMVLWLNGALTLLSFAPCSLDCKAAHALAERTLAALDRDGFAERWRAQATAIHALDEEGACVVLHGDGALEDGLRVTRAVRLRPGMPPEQTELPIERVTLSRGRLCDEHGLLSASFFADHRRDVGPRPTSDHRRSAENAASSPERSAADGVVTSSARR